MGKKGERRTGVAKVEAEAVVRLLEPLGGVAHKGMFGGYGIFRNGVMFGLVNSAGELHLRVNEVTKPRFEALDAPSHGRMPYMGVPASVRSDDAVLREWATEAADVALAAKGAS